MDRQIQETGSSVNQQADSSMLVYLGQTAHSNQDPTPSPYTVSPPIQNHAISKLSPPPYINSGRTKSITLLGMSAAAAVMYAICFSGAGKLPQLSFTIFSLMIFFMLVKILETLGYLRNRRALLFAAPIAALALMNGIFSINFYSYANIVIVHILFAAFAISALTDYRINLFSISGAGKIIKAIAGNWITVFSVIRWLFTSRLERKQRSDKISKILLGVLCALPLLLVIGTLLISADMVFANIMDNLIYYIIVYLSKIDIAFIITICIAFTYFAGYIWHSKAIACLPEKPYSPIPADNYICASFLATLNSLFLFFTIIQTAFLFTGGLMKLPGDMVYSEYVREGFFQLLAVTIINFAVIYILLTVYSGVNEKPVLKAMVYMLLGFTVVLIASSFYRMFMYISVYAFTPLRLGVITFLVMELVLVWITAEKLKKTETHFVRRFVITCLVFYIIANVSASGYVSARLNVNMFLSGGKMRWIDATSSGADGLAVIRPFLESDKYICRGNLIIRRNEPDVPYFFIGSEMTYEDVKNTLSHKSDIWQNWSLIESVLGFFYVQHPLIS